LFEAQKAQALADAPELEAATSYAASDSQRETSRTNHHSGDLLWQMEAD
jgi:hypothetical protein